MGGTGDGAVNSRKAGRGIGMLLALGLAAAGAAPADDYRAGLGAYHRGDVVAAMAALRPAASAGHAPSQALLAFILERADLVDDALALYRSAAAQDDPEAHAGLANLYLAGRGVAKDEKQAFAHFSKAADLGHAASIQVVADAYLGGQMGIGQTPADDARGVVALQRAAGIGHLPALEGLARAHRSGRFGLPVDPTQAAAWEVRAAELRRQRVARPVRPASAP